MGFKKGQSGNPGGRPADKAFADMLRVVCSEEDPKRKKRKLRVLADKVYQKAANGEVWAMSMIADRLDGKPAQDSTVTIDDKRDAIDYSRADLQTYLAQSVARNGGGGTAEEDGRSREPDSVH